jgi:hypothetical protein
LGPADPEVSSKTTGPMVSWPLSNEAQRPIHNLRLVRKFEPVRYANCNSFGERRRRIAKPTAPKPSSIIAQVLGSGTDGLT